MRDAEAIRDWDSLEAEVSRIGCEAGLGPVRGAGDRRAALVLVGEAPGETEAREGRPFAGAAGRILDAALAEAGIDRPRIWVTNTVKCRPVREQGGRRLNRAPTAAEVRLWKPLLEAELALIAPRLIVCLGAVAAKALLDPGFVMQRQRGHWFPLPSGASGSATYHPAYVFRLDGATRDEATAALAADLRAARRRLDEAETAGSTDQESNAARLSR
jgi:DNA polymerase